MLIRLLGFFLLFAWGGAATAADTITVVYLGTNDCPYCQHWEARAKGELLASPEAGFLRYVEVKGETLRQPIVERHYPDDLKWLGRELGPMRGVPRFLLLVNGKVAWSVIGTNDYERVFKPAIKDAVSRRNGPG